VALQVDLLMADRLKFLEAQEAAAKADPNGPGTVGMHAPLMLTAGPTGYGGHVTGMPGYGVPPTGYQQYPGMGMPPPTNGMGGMHPQHQAYM
jgi:hypothetical protein